MVTLQSQTQGIRSVGQTDPADALSAFEHGKVAKADCGASTYSGSLFLVPFWKRTTPFRRGVRPDFSFSVPHRTDRTRITVRS
jgi:hypothetical protein